MPEGRTVSAEHRQTCWLRTGNTKDGVGCDGKSMRETKACAAPKGVELQPWAGQRSKWPCGCDTAVLWCCYSDNNVILGMS